MEQVVEGFVSAKSKCWYLILSCGHWIKTINPMSDCIEISCPICHKVVE